MNSISSIVVSTQELSCLTMNRYFELTHLATFPFPKINRSTRHGYYTLVRFLLILVSRVFSAILWVRNGLLNVSILSSKYISLDCCLLIGLGKICFVLKIFYPSPNQALKSPGGMKKICDLS